MDGCIDVHHHVPSAEIAEAATEVGIPMAGAWTPEMAMAAMDASGIAAAVLTPTIFVADGGDPAAAVPLHRATNDYLSGVARRWPHRFGAFATLPLVDPDAARAELDRAFDDLGMDGVLLPSGVGPDLIGAEPFTTTAPPGTLAYLRRMYFDVAVTCHPNAFPSLRTVTDIDHIVFGTDYPAFSQQDVDEAMAFLVNESGFTEDELDAIASKNIKPLFPRLTADMQAAG